MPNIENYVTYAHWQHDVIGHLLTLTFAVFAAALVYFLATAKESAPRYRLSSTISAVVMVSAALEVGQLWISWDRAFDLDRAAGVWRPAEGAVFSNGFRYINWSIDVPMLLTQVLVVLGFQGREFWARWWKLAGAGALMVWTGYAGQYFEPQIAGLAPGDGSPFWIWFAVSSVFYLYVLYALRAAIANPSGDMGPHATAEFGRLWALVLVSWTIYPVAYAIPAFWVDGTAMVVRQGLFTVADISSKVLFGVMLARAARFRSEHDGWSHALAVEGRVAPGHLPPARNPARGAAAPAAGE